MTGVTGARWDVGEPLALASEIPVLGYDLDLFAPKGTDWSRDTTAIINAAIQAAFDAGGGEVVVQNAGRIYRWLAVQMKSNVGIRFVGNPTIRKSGGVAGTHILEFLGTEGSVSSALVVNHPLTSPLTVTGASWAANVATITIGSHSLLAGDQIQTTGITPTGYNHLATVTAVTSTTFSFALTSNPGSYTSGGTVKVMPFNVHPTSASGFAVGDVVAVMDNDVVYSASPVGNITAASWDSGTKVATITLSASPQTAVGDPILISGASSSGPGSFTGVFAVLSSSGFTVTYRLQSDPGTWSSGGTGIYSEGQDLELNKITAITGNQIVMEHALNRTYETASAARLVKLNTVENAYLVGPARFELTDGTLGGGIFWHYAYNCRLRDVDVYGANDQAGFYVMRSGRISLKGWGAYANQRLDIVGYGLIVSSSSHHVRAEHGFSDRVRENGFSNGAMDCTFENNTVEWTYDDGINTHGSGCRRIRIANNHIGHCNGAGITVAFGSSHSADYDVDILGNSIYDTLTDGIAVKGNGVTNNQGVRVKGNTLVGIGGTHGILVQSTDDAEVQGNTVQGAGIVWNLVNRLAISGNTVRGVSGPNLSGTSSSGVMLGPNMLDDSDVSLEGTEILVGTDSLAGALSVTLTDADITPDPVYRFQVWPITASRTVHAPTATKRAIGQRITIDVRNVGVAPIVPVWDAVFVLAKPFGLAAP